MKSGWQFELNFCFPCLADFCLVKQKNFVPYVKLFFFACYIIMNRLKSSLLITMKPLPSSFSIFFLIIKGDEKKGWKLKSCQNGNESISEAKKSLNSSPQWFCKISDKNWGLFERWWKSFKCEYIAWKNIRKNIGTVN